MVMFSSFFSKKTLAYLAATFALTGALFVISAVLDVVFSYALPIDFEFHSSHQYVVGDTAIDELQRRIDALAAADPQVQSAQLKEQADSPESCGGPSLDLKVSSRAMVFSGSENYYNFVERAVGVGLGQRCGSNSITIKPGHYIVLVHGLLALLVLVFIWRSRHGRHTFKLNWSDWTPRIGWLEAVLWGVLSGVVATLVVTALEWLLLKVGVQPIPDTYWDTFANVHFLALLPLAVIAAPIFEEFLFRAWMMERLTRVLPTTLALLMSASSFAAIHFPQSLMEVTQLFLAGLILGAIWWRFRSLIACVVTHAVYNAFAFGMYWYELGH